jgi:hypothetical protein
VHRPHERLVRHLQVTEVVRHEPQRRTNVEGQSTIAPDILAPCEVAPAARRRVAQLELKAVGHENRCNELASRAEHVDRLVHNCQPGGHYNVDREPAETSTS